MGWWELNEAWGGGWYGSDQGQTSLSLFFPSFVRLIDVFNTLSAFSTLCHFLTLKSQHVSA
jgi:hypothetical protein